MQEQEARFRFGIISLIPGPSGPSCFLLFGVVSDGTELLGRPWQWSLVLDLA